MKAKVLYFTYDDRSSTKLICAYDESASGEADRTLEFLSAYGSSDKNYYLQELEIITSKTDDGINK